MKNENTRRGFTLIEVLVVVLIIAVLAAVAVPQYQRAVLKSRFTAMMPIGKTLANANEAYYLEHGSYANNPQDLPVQGQSSYPDGTAILLYPGTDDLSFVRVKNETDVPNAQYVVYQKHSKNFPDTTWCEAGDERAEALCVALGGVIPTGVTGNSSGQDGWKAYLLTGQTREGDSFVSADAACIGEKPDPVTASESGATGKAKCVNGEWKYEWTVGNTYNDQQEHVAESPYAYAGSIFEDAACIGLAEGACTGSTFVVAACIADGEGQHACADSTFNNASNCNSNAENGCTNSTFNDASNCNSNAENGCANSTFNDNSGCDSSAENGCTNSTFNDNSWCYGGGENACINSTFTDSSSCDAHTTSGCAGNTFTGSSFCSNQERGTCTNNTFESGSYCEGSVSYGCTGNTFAAGSHCDGSIFSGCTGNTFAAGSHCDGSVDGGCYLNSFTGDGSYCSGGNQACTENTFSGAGSYCESSGAYGCAGSTFSGQGSYCKGTGENTCVASTFKTGSYCEGTGCDQASYDGGCCKGDYCGNAPQCNF